MRTLFHALTICVGLFVLMAGVFTRPELVIEPGMAQIGAMLLILVATTGVSFSLQATITERRPDEWSLRLELAACALTLLLHPGRDHRRVLQPAGHVYGAPPGRLGAAPCARCLRAHRAAAS